MRVSGAFASVIDAGDAAATVVDGAAAAIEALTTSWSSVSEKLLGGVDLAAAALQFSLHSPLVDTTVVGIPSIDRLEALAGLVAGEVPEEFFDAVEELGAPPASGND